MTALAARRRKRTWVGGALAVVLVLLAAGLTAVGANTVINSTEGEAVLTDERPVVALPQTDNAALAVVDEQNRLTSLVVATLLPSGQGGSIVTIPVDADASYGLGDLRRPLDGVLDPADPEGFFQAVEETLAVSLLFGEIVGADRVAELIGPAAPVTVELPFVPVEPQNVDDARDADDVDVTDDADVTDDGGAQDDAGAVPEGEDESSDTTPLDTAPLDTALAETVPAETVPPETMSSESTAADAADSVETIELLSADEFDAPAIAEVLRSTLVTGSAAEQHMNDVAMWSAIARAAPIGGGDVPVDEFDVPLTAASVDEVFSRLLQGTVQVRDLAVSSLLPRGGDTNESVSVLDRFDSLLVFAQISPARVSTPNEGLVFRVEVPISDAQLAADSSPFGTRSDVAWSAVGQLLFLQGNVISVDTTPSTDGAPTATRVAVADEQLVAGLEDDIVDVFGDVEFVTSTELIDGVDVVMTLGTGYLDTIAGNRATSAADDAAANDADTVDDDG